MVFSGVDFCQRDFYKSIKTKKGQICYPLFSIRKQHCSTGAVSKMYLCLLGWRTTSPENGVQCSAKCASSLQASTATSAFGGWPQPWSQTSLWLRAEPELLIQQQGARSHCWAVGTALLVAATWSPAAAEPPAALWDQPLQEKAMQCRTQSIGMTRTESEVDSALLRSVWYACLSCGQH